MVCDIVSNTAGHSLTIGEVVCISEGRIDHEDVFSICNGQLVLSLTKETYERTGLQGQPSNLVSNRRSK
jgi:ribonuclease P/MRP protein subunit RPP40